MKKVYNENMNDLGLLSVSPSYMNSVSSAYRTSQASSLREIPEIGAGKLSSDDSDDIVDEAIISDEAMSLLAAEKSEEVSGQPSDVAEKNADSEDEGSEDKTLNSEDSLTPEQKEEVAKLEARDAEVKAHEQAHLAAAAGISASAPSYDYQTGPDGKKYAVGGEVSISFSKTNDPDENIANAQTMKAAALAPAEPSGQDLAVARNADKLIAEAEKEKAQQQSENSDSSDSTDNSMGDKTSGETCINQEQSDA